MTLTLFEGPAGSGKTTRLFDAVAEWLGKHSLGPDKRILALTKVHGSRRRMQTKLDDVLGRRVAADCVTLDSFAGKLGQRWRSLAQSLGFAPPRADDFAAVTTIAATLLERDAVLHWVLARYPLLVVDELQDLRGPDLGVVRGLARGLEVMCAADEFQELNPSGVCEAVTWARAAGPVVSLTQVRRTSVAGLLDAARCVREGAELTNGTGFKRFAPRNANVAASFLARNLTWWSTSQVAVLSPTGPNSSPFVRSVLERLAQKPFVTGGKPFGPFTIPWEASQDNERKRWEAVLRLGDGTGTRSAAEILDVASDLPAPLLDWVRSRYRIAGELAFSVELLRLQIGKAQAALRAYASPRSEHLTGLGVYQAKNREFDKVVVLWPVAIGGGAEVHRRLLYNAITRAKRECLLLVQDPNPKKSRLTSPPFTELTRG